jgi:predicted ATPase
MRLDIVESKPMTESLPTIRKLILKRFRSITLAEIDFSNPTFLVGRNGAGKSNVLSALEFLADAMQLPLRAVMDRNGGITAVRNKTSAKGYPPNLAFRVEFGAINGTVRSAIYAFEIKALKNYGFEVVREQCIVENNQGERKYFDRTGSEIRSNVGIKPDFDSAALSLPVIGGVASFQPILQTLRGMRVSCVEPGRLRILQEPDAGTSLKPDGSNTASVLQELGRRSPEDFQRVCEILQSIVPNTTAVRVSKHGKSLALDFTQSWGSPENELRFEAFSMSDGTLRAIGLLAAVYQQPKPVLLAVEEPESTMHPGALGAVMDLLRHASRNFQLVVTTHSPDVLDAEWIAPEMIRLVDWNAGSTRISPLAKGSKDAISQHLMSVGEMLRADALQPIELFDEVVERAQLEMFENVQ